MLIRILALPRIRSPDFRVAPLPCRPPRPCYFWDRLWSTFYAIQILQAQMWGKGQYHGYSASSSRFSLSYRMGPQVSDPYTYWMVLAALVLSGAKSDRGGKIIRNIGWGMAGFRWGLTVFSPQSAIRNRRGIAHALRGFALRNNDN